MTLSSIDALDPEIAKWIPIWRYNREMVTGESAVKPAGTRYLPQSSGMNAAQYKAAVIRTPFFPGASRTCEGLLGLMFRREASKVFPAAYEGLMEYITEDGYPIDVLAYDVAQEFLQTNFVGLLTDFPISNAPVSQADAVAAGLTPYISTYIAESILGIEVGRVLNRQQVVRVRLLEDAKTVRELRLDDGVYSITLWSNESGQWIADEPIIPLKRGKPFNEIPFTLVSTNRKFQPAKAKLHDVCRINGQHYIASANLADADYLYSHPIPYIFGVADGTKLDLGKGRFVSHPDPNTKIGMVEYNGQSISELRTRVTDLTEDMAKFGSRILASEKAAAEAAETLAIRRASENAMLASTSHLISEKITDQLKFIADWLGLDLDSFDYAMNTDFNSLPLDGLALQARMQLFLNGVISHDAIVDMLVDCDILPDNFDRELDRQLIAEDVADRPAASAIIPATTTLIAGKEGTDK